MAQQPCNEDAPGEHIHDIQSKCTGIASTPNMPEVVVQVMCVQYLGKQQASE